MRNIRIAFLTLALILSAGCTKKNSVDGSEDAVTQQASIEEIKYPFEMVDVKTESPGGRTSRMELWVPTGTFDTQLLKEFCSEQRKKNRFKGYYFLVVFDKTENAVLPSNPLTALYGTDESPQKHIKALYQYNDMNGLSELNTYASNMWDGNPVTETIY